MTVIKLNKRQIASLSKEKDHGRKQSKYYKTFG